jgi:hypothetical protein
MLNAELKAGLFIQNYNKKLLIKKLEKIRTKVLLSENYTLHTKHCALKSVAFCLLLSALSSSCEKGEQFDCVKSTGKIIKEERIIGMFHSINTKDNVNLIFTNDTTQTIIVEAGENLLRKIKTEVTDNILNISNENRCNWVRSYKKEVKIFIGIKNSTNIFHYGYGDITCEGQLNKDALFLHHYSSGDVNLNIKSKLIWMDMDRLGNLNLQGECDTLIAHNYNLGKLNTRNLITNTCYLINEGQAEVHVHSNNTLGVTIKNKGNVYYYGNPLSVDFIKKGEGELIKGD